MAIISVLLHHGGQLPFHSEWQRAWNSLVSFGYFGGELFLVMSGYFMTASLLKVRDGRRTLGTQYLYRYVRLAPLYFIALAVCVGVIPFCAAAFSGRPLGEFLPRAESVALYAVCMSNVSIAAYGPTNLFDITWTLNVQEQVYLLWIPAVAFAPRRWLTALCLAAIALAAVARPVAFGLGLDHQTIHVLAPFRMDALAVGSLLAILRDTGAIPRRNFTRLALIATVAFAAVLVAFPIHASGWYVRFGYTAMAGLGALWLLAGLTVDPSSRTGRLFGHPWLRWYGQRSYAIYLFHYPVYFALIAITWKLLGRPYQYGMTSQSTLNAVLGLVTVFACVPVAWLAWYFVERPIERFRKGPAPVSVPAPETKRIRLDELQTQALPAVVRAPRPPRVYDDEDALTPPMGMAAFS